MTHFLYYSAASADINYSNEGNHTTNYSHKLQCVVTESCGRKLTNNSWWFDLNYCEHIIDEETRYIPDETTNDVSYGQMRLIKPNDFNQDRIRTVQTAESVADRQRKRSLDDGFTHLHLNYPHTNIPCIETDFISRPMRKQHFLALMAEYELCKEGTFVCDKLPITWNRGEK